MHLAVSFYPEKYNFRVLVSLPLPCLVRALPLPLYLPSPRFVFCPCHALAIPLPLSCPLPSPCPLPCAPCPLPLHLPLLQPLPLVLGPLSALLVSQLRLALLACLSSPCRAAFVFRVIVLIVGRAPLVAGLSPLCFGLGAVYAFRAKTKVQPHRWLCGGSI